MNPITIENYRQFLNLAAADWKPTWTGFVGFNPYNSSLTPVLNALESYGGTPTRQNLYRVLTVMVAVPQDRQRQYRRALDYMERVIAPSALERQPPLPHTGVIAPEEVLARRVSLDMENVIRHGVDLNSTQDNRDPSLMGVALYRVTPSTGTLTLWPRQGAGDLHYGAMVGSYPTADIAPERLVNAKLLCTSLLERAGILRYLAQLSSELANYNVVAHLHYYRNRDVPDPGFHKDTRGQTLFFMLQYLNDRPIFGPEWVEDHAMDLLHDDTKFVWVTSGGRQYLKAAGANVFWEPRGERGYERVDLDRWEALGRVSPTDVASVWPASIRGTLGLEKQLQVDDKIHAARIEPYGAVLVVDDLVHHRSPNPKTRAQWGNLGATTRDQATTVQAFNASHENRLYQVDLTRARRARSLSNVRESVEEWRRAREQLAPSESRAASSSDALDLLIEPARPVADLSEPAERARWENTFSGARRKFFRLWVTVSPRPVRSPADKVWY